MPEPTPTTHPMSFRLSPAARAALAEMAARSGLGRSALVEIAIRQLHAAGSLQLEWHPAAPPEPPAQSPKGD